MSRQPIDFLFSPYRRQALSVLFLSPDERFHVRQLARLTGISAGSLHRELKAMAEAGLLERTRQGNQVLYQVARGCPIYAELASIFRKTIGLADLLRDCLEPLAAHIELAFVFGSMAAGTQHSDSDLDICVIGDISLFDVSRALASCKDSLRREINPVVLSTSDFIEQLAAGDRFAERLYREEKVFVIGSEHDLGKLTED